MAIFPQQHRTFVASSAPVTRADVGDFVLISTGPEDAVVLLPPVGDGNLVTIKKTDNGAGGIKVVTTDSAQVDGVLGITGRRLTGQFTAWTLWSDGANWWQA